jgi:hypothetical protein
VDLDNDGRLDLVVLRYLKWDFSDLFAVNTVRGTAPIAILMKCAITACCASIRRIFHS